MRAIPHSPERRGFTMIEMLGVVAIMAIVAAVLLPNVARRISRTNGEREEQALSVLADGLLRYVQANQTIPGSSSWHSNIATYAGLNVTEVQRVDPDDSSSARVYLINPSFSPGSPSSSPVWTQTSTGAVSTANATVMIISTHKSSLTLPVASGVAASQSAFDNIWNWNYDASTKDPPSGWSSTWTDNGEYLHVRRINFAPLFHHVTFSNTDYPTNYPQRQVGTASTTTLNSAAAIDAYYLMGTAFKLYKASGAGSTLDISHTLQNGVNFLYESNRWRVP